MTQNSIYGVRMPGTMGDVIHQLDGLRPLISQKAATLIAAAVAQVAIDYHDRAIVLGGDLPASPLELANRDIKARIAEVSRTNTRDPQVDASFEVIICDDATHAVLMSFTEHQDWFTDLLSLPGATDFSYWDGSPRPEGVSAQEWAIRRRTYQRILSRDPHGRPQGCGVSLTYQKPIGTPALSAIMEQIPSLDARCLRMARQTLLADWVSEQGQDTPDINEMMTFAQTLSCPDMHEKVAERAGELRELLTEITEEALTCAVMKEEAPSP